MPVHTCTICYIDRVWSASSLVDHMRSTCVDIERDLQHANFFKLSTVVVEGCKNETSFGWSNFFFVLEDCTPSYSAKMTGRSERYNQFTHRRNASKESAKIQKKKQTLVPRVTESFGWNLAWSRGPHFPHHTEMTYILIPFLIPVILTNKGAYTLPMTC